MGQHLIECDVDIWEIKELSRVSNKESANASNYEEALADFLTIHRLPLALLHSTSRIENDGK